MALSRGTVLLLLLPSPAVVYLWASLEDVNASSQCLPSAEAVRQEYPGAWASWTSRDANHKGVRCWFPAMRENHARRLETVLRKNEGSARNNSAERNTAERNTAERNTVERNTVERNTAERRRIEPVVDNKIPDETPLASASEMNELGWSFRTRTTKIGFATLFDEAVMVDSSFDDRFAAAFEVSSVRQPSVIQRMMDPVGAIP